MRQAPLRIGVSDVEARDQVRQLHDEATAAARQENCGAVDKLAETARDLAADNYDELFVRDSTIAACLEQVRQRIERRGRR